MTTKYSSLLQKATLLSEQFGCESFSEEDAIDANRNVITTSSLDALVTAGLIEKIPASYTVVLGHEKLRGINL